jgi:thiamine-phosphate pyrophosphorylase
MHEMIPMDERDPAADANITRGVESLGVVEKICRSVLDEPALAVSVNNVRDVLARFGATPDRAPVGARRSKIEVAPCEPAPEPTSIRQAFNANMTRALKAIQDLEKYHSRAATIMEQRRILRDLGREIYKKLRRKLPFEDDVYAVSADVETLKRAVLDGAAIIQLRDKTSAPRIIYDKALAIAAFCKDRECVFILNDDAELAVKTGADGVHIGQDSDTAQVRAIVGQELIIGCSTHDIAQGLKAQAEKLVDYISVGPVYATPTKPGRLPVGLSYIREAGARLTLPFVAIGGIDRTNLDDVLGAGAHTVGVVRQAHRTEELLGRIRAWKR